MASVIDEQPAEFVLMSQRERVRAGVAALSAVLVILLAALLVPDDRGLGTHEQLGLPSCMTLRVFGIPCPFCGMTTAFSHMAHGQPFQAIQTQPAGALAFGLAIVFAMFNGIVACTARTPAILKKPLTRRLTVGLGIAIILVAWIYKVIAYL